MTRGLATRLARLEKQRRPRRTLPAIILARYGEPEDGIVGLTDGRGAVTARRWHETLDALAERARPAGGLPCMLAAVYRAPVPVTAPPAPLLAPEAPRPKFDRATANWSEWRQQEGLKP